MVKVKICGVMTVGDAVVCAQAGADMIGLNFFKRSPRYIDPDSARDIAASMRAEYGAKCPLLVGVFVNEIVSSISGIVDKVGLNCAQLSGDESGEMLKELRGIGFKAIRPRSKTEAMDDAAYYLKYTPNDERMPTLLLDSHHPALYGGTGELASTDVALAVREATPRMMLAGGLTPGNVGYSVHEIHPWGVDVASGVEVDGEPGRKDADKVRAFVDAVRAMSEG